MARIKIEIPGNPIYRVSVPVRITDINYGNHLGNDSMVSIIHEARMSFLKASVMQRWVLKINTGYLLCRLSIPMT